MTRVNLIEPSKLSDQHLKAEIRELNRIGSLVEKYLQKKPSEIPSKFSLGTGHVKFFYNKGKYLHKRFQSLREELNHRGFIRYYDYPFHNTWTEELYQDWKPTEEDYKVLKERILSKILMKPSWYKFYNKSIDIGFYNSYL